jgi:glycosyltransferase involved in cell wall biosynthesis
LEKKCTNSSLSIITAVFNGSSTIRDCLQSVCIQSLSVDHLIIDGSSTDNTLDIVREINPQARIVSERDHGIYDAMNKGILLSTGDVIGILNADDLYASPDVLAKVAAIFDDPSVDCCYGDLMYVKEIDSKRSGEGYRNGDFIVTRYWRSGEFNPNRFYRGWMPPHPTFFVRRRIYEKYGSFNLNLGSAADYELMLRFLLKHRINTVYIPEVLVRMRAGGVSNASVKNRLRANLMDRKAWGVSGMKPFPWTLYLKPARKLLQWLIRPPVFPS